MGHIRLGHLARTRKWNQVVALIGGGAGAMQVAIATVLAAEKAFGRAANDKGVLEVVWLLFQLPIAARNENFAAALRDCGLNVSSSPGLLDIIGALSDAVDARMQNCNGRTDLGEMAQMAATETLVEIIGDRTKGLFGSAPEDVQREFAKLATAAQFSVVGKAFFGRFMTKCMGFFVSRALPLHLGAGQRFSTLAQQSDFAKALETHCKQAARIVDTYSGEWFSKAKWESKGDISREMAQRFTGYAMSKLIAELKQGAEAHAH